MNCEALLALEGQRVFMQTEYQVGGKTTVIFRSYVLGKPLYMLQYMPLTTGMSTIQSLGFSDLDIKISRIEMPSVVNINHDDYGKRVETTSFKIITEQGKEKAFIARHTETTMEDNFVVTEMFK